MAAELGFAAATTKGFEELPPVPCVRSSHYGVLFEEQEKELHAKDIRMQASIPAASKPATAAPQSRLSIAVIRAASA